MTAEASQYIDSADSCNGPSKICSGCSTRKPVSEFTPQVGGRLGVRTTCKRCRAKKTNGYEPRQPRDMSEGYRWIRIKAKYGLSKDQYLEMLDRQGYGCAICGTADPKGRFGRFMVDHCHATGAVRGLLCGRCNTALGVFGDTAEGLERAVSYLRGTLVRVPGQ